MPREQTAISLGHKYHDGRVGTWKDARSAPGASSLETTVGGVELRAAFSAVKRGAVPVGHAARVGEVVKLAGVHAPPGSHEV